MKDRLRHTACDASRILLSGDSSLEMSKAVLPALAVSVTLGRRFATATPMRALAECRLASAARTSGRCSISAEGKLTGTLRGNWNDAMVNVSTSSWLGKPPINATSRCRCWINCLCSAGNVCSIWASAASFATTSASAICPSPCWRRRRSSRSRTILMIFSVAAIWPRNEASCTAARTMLDVKVRCVASS